MSNQGTSSPRELRRKPRPIRAKQPSPRAAGRGGTARGPAVSGHAPSITNTRRGHASYAAMRDAGADANTHFLQSCLEEHPHQRDACPEVATPLAGLLERGGTEPLPDVEDCKNNGAGKNVSSDVSDVMPNGSSGYGIRDVINKFQRDQKSSREVLFLQHQFNQEDADCPSGRGRGGGELREVVGEVSSSPPWQGNGTHHTPRHNNNTLPWKFISPSGHYADGNFIYRRSPNFRRTPGASRPPTTRGLYPNPAAARNNAPFWNGSNSRSFFQGGGGTSSKMLHVSDLCGDSGAGPAGGGNNCGGGRAASGGGENSMGAQPMDSTESGAAGGSAQPAPVSERLVIGPEHAERALPAMEADRFRGPPSISSADRDRGSGTIPTTSGAIQLMVSNLDYNISAREWKKILTAEFQQHVHVLSSYIQTQADNTNVAYVQVASTDEARYAISQFHRKKIGYKRIHVCLINSDTNATAANTRLEVVGLLKEVTGNTLPLFKFIEMFEKRYHRGISVSELYRMRDVIEIEEQGGTGRTVGLLAPNVAVAATSDGSDQEGEELEPLVCKAHCTEGSAGYVAALDSACLPNVVLQLKGFSAQVHTLLQTHDGSMELMSFQSCYESEFRSLPVSLDGGVPLEHLISCVQGVKVAITRSGVKKIQWAENKPPNQEAPRIPIQQQQGGPTPLMTQQLSQFSREVVDLLKHTPQCRMSFSKFIPAYHHHYGRQCRVADYGYTKLMELFEAIPHVVQIIGSGSRRFVTLSHRTQVKRFTADLLRVLKSQASKQIAIMDMPIVYNKVICKAFDITDYGVCYVEDILSEMPESTVLVQGVGQKMVILIPRREQTLEEGERTKQFAVEVIDLLRHSPQCRMPFNKFIPAYHHHFGKQCRVADYGFTKLIELFESIPHILKLEEEDDDKMLCLTEGELVRVLEDQMTQLLRSCPDEELPVPELLNTFMRFHGHGLRLQDYGVNSVCELVLLIPDTAAIDTSTGRSIIRLVDHSAERSLAFRVLILLMDRPNASMTVEQLGTRYYETYRVPLVPDSLSALRDYLVISEDPSGEGTVVRLNPLQLFARDVRTVLRCNNDRLSLQHFEAVYAQHFGVSLVPPAYGYPSVCALVQAVPHVATIRGKGYRRLVLLTPEFQGVSDITSPTAPSVNMGATMSPNQPTNAQMYSDSCPDVFSDPCTNPCTDTSCTLHSTASCISSPCNDSGITECTNFSPEDASSPPEESSELPKVASPKGRTAQRHLSFDPGNVPVPDTFSSYDDCLAPPPTPKTPCSTILNMAAQLLPQENSQCSYVPNGGYRIPGATYPYPDQPYINHYAPDDGYQSYVSYTHEHYGQDYYVGNADYHGNYIDGAQEEDGVYDEDYNSQEYVSYRSPSNGSYRREVSGDPPPSPPPYPQSFPRHLHGHVPITCESLEASNLQPTSTTAVTALENASAKLKDLCVSAPPPSLSPQNLGLPTGITDDNNNDVTFPDAESDEPKLLTVNLDYEKYNSGIKTSPVKSDRCGFSIGVTKGGCPKVVSLTSLQLISPRKKRLAARFDKEPSACSVSVESVTTASTLKIEM